MLISDREVLGLIIGRYMSATEASTALGLPRHTFANWRRKGIARAWRRTLWLACRERGVHFSEEWCNAPQERARIRKAMRALASDNTNKGAGNGKAGPEQDQAERPQRRRAAGGRGVPAPPR